MKSGLEFHEKVLKIFDRLNSVDFFLKISICDFINVAEYFVVDLKYSCPGVIPRLSKKVRLE